jgi:hypothetical protein
MNFLIFGPRNLVGLSAVWAIDDARDFSGAIPVTRCPEPPTTGFALHGLFHERIIHLGKIDSHEWTRPECEVNAACVEVVSPS